MEVISYLSHGCIFKVNVEVGYAMEHVKIKCNSPKHESDWLNVHQTSNEDNTENGKRVCYQIKELNEEMILLKIENLEVRRKYEIRLKTNQQEYKNQFTIPGKETSHNTTMISEYMNTFFVYTSNS